MRYTGIDLIVLDMDLVTIKSSTWIISIKLSV